MGGKSQSARKKSRKYRPAGKRKGERGKGKWERELTTRSGPDWEAFKKIIEVINMYKDMEWTKKYYSEEARQELTRRNVPRELIEKGEREWAILIKDIEAALATGEDPTSKNAQALVERWSKLIKSFTGGSGAIQEGLNKMYADQANWPSTFKKPYSDEVGAFMYQAMALRKKG